MIAVIAGNFAGAQAGKAGLWNMPAPAEKPTAETGCQ